MVKLISSAYLHARTLLNWLQSPLLLAIRLYWGWQFAQDGWGKLTHLDKVTQFFASLNLPAPGMTALAIALVELAGGVFLALGIASRHVAGSLRQHDHGLRERARRPHQFLACVFQPSDFYGATPYTYWFAALLILIFGPGLIAVDTLLGRKFAPGRKA